MEMNTPVSKAYTLLNNLSEVGQARDNISL